MATITRRGDAYVCVSAYAEKEIPKNAGFIWDRVVPRMWATKIDRVAAKLAHLADATCREHLLAATSAHTDTLAASRATDAAVVIPAPEGMAYLPYQRAGIAYALAHPRCMLGDEMGLGKTIQAIGVINADSTMQNILIICPASLKLNWARECRKWLTRDLSIGLATGSEWPQTNIIIINYDILKNRIATIRGREWDMLVLDEFHYLKNPKSQRSIAVLGKWDKDPTKAIPSIKARRVAALSGTPVVNRPIELQPVAGYLAPREFGNFWAFAKRYADAHQNGYGWDLTGASHLDELQERLRACIMVRRLKKDVLPELPSKRRQVIEIAANGAAKLVAQEAAAWAPREEALAHLYAAVALADASDDAAAYAAAVEALSAGARVAFEEISKIRHETAMAKLPYILEHIQGVLEGGSKVVVFAHHHDIIDAIAAECPNAAVVDGRTPLAARDAAVQRFQNDPSCPLFVGSIGAAGAGITLTAAHHVVFAELDWVPGRVSQAEDRCHRIGQHDAVLVQHLVLENSIDCRMAHILVEKQHVLDAALDDPATILAASIPVLPGMDAHITRAPAAPVALDQNTVAAVHRCVRILAGMDTDGATELNNIGYNKMDSHIGRSLAEQGTLSNKQALLGQKIVKKYHRQLPGELYAAAMVAAQ